MIEKSKTHMKLVSVTPLAIPAVVAITFSRFNDERGYFSETYQKQDFWNLPELAFFEKPDFTQINESYSKSKVVRGMHLQWNPFMGKMIRAVQGHLVDMALDIRHGSPTLGKIIALDMPAHIQDTQNTWVWLPPGFAHGTYFLEETIIEYFCTGQYSPGNEVGIHPFAPDLDWSLCDPRLATQLHELRPVATMSEKDKKGMNLQTWLADDRSKQFSYANQKSILEKT